MTMLLFAAVMADSQTTRSLEPCPSSPNCISSQADPEDKTHYLAPFAYTMPEADLLDLTESILLSKPRTELIERDGNYLHVTFKSFVFRFVDDVEVLLEPEAKLLHFRSAARLGKGDFGVNRRRMKWLVEELQAKAH
ncbi:MAG: DUF1499 domain-containing protein [Trueperaceae bacterium]|nr:DUF1499 domain-containing protein [Trueperaceae bacterium]